MTATRDQPASEPRGIWEFDLDPIDYWHYDTKVMQKYPNTLIINERTYAEQDYLLAKRYGMVKGDQHPFPANMPAFILNYPSEDGFLPDFFSSTGLLLCSARLRASMALPPDVVQYLDLDVQAPDRRVHVMDYKVLRVLAHQPVVDLARSDVEIDEEVDRHIGGTYQWVSYTRRLALRAGLTAQTDLFHADEVSSPIFATDALAERVMRAGCWGVEFRHPEEPSLSDNPPTIRTARGVEQAGPKARRAHLRLVKQVRDRHGLAP